jgi:hypothetical protein
MFSTKEGEDPCVKIGEALDSLTSHNSGSGSRTFRKRCIPLDSGHARSTLENPTSAMSDSSSKMHAGLEGKVRVPSELISSCISTYLMIQVNLIFHVFFRVIVAFIY